jgi:tRNA(fMet)-specific endonuclease VapC
VSQSYVLDTSVLLFLLRGREVGDLIDRTYGLRASFYLHSISIVTHAELWVLVERNGWGERQQAVVERALSEFVTVDVAGAAIVEAYRKVEAASHGRTMGKNDIWVAATAMIAGLPLITTDTDFQHLDGKLLMVKYVNPKLTL